MYLRDMKKEKRQPLMHLEWRLSLVQYLIGIPAVLSSFALPAWSARAAGILGEYAPFSWVAAGFGGVFLTAIAFAIGAWAYGRIVRNRYDSAILDQSGNVDPFAQTFESKRIYLNTFTHPSNPLIDGKSFINCEIIGPAEMWMDHGNTLVEHRVPNVDCVAIPDGLFPNNAHIIRNCIFKNCKFIKTTFLVSETQAKAVVASGYEPLPGFFRWISASPFPALVSPAEGDPSPTPEGIEQETPPKTSP